MSDLYKLFCRGRSFLGDPLAAAKANPRVGLYAATPHATAMPTLLRGFRCYPYREIQVELVRKIPAKNTKFAHYLNIQ
ncbi:MAG: hypothetical protein KAY95_00965 [Kaistella sp.]|nr:hypothetical protein [Kaistella sp.]